LKRLSHFEPWNGVLLKDLGQKFVGNEVLSGSQRNLNIVFENGVWYNMMVFNIARSTGFMCSRLDELLVSFKVMGVIFFLSFS
jgi:hypothetical protein